MIQISFIDCLELKPKKPIGPSTIQQAVTLLAVFKPLTACSKKCWGVVCLALVVCSCFCVCANTLLSVGGGME